MDDIEKTVHWLGHSSFRLEGADGKTVYIDPYKVSAPEKKADVVLVTHAHSDHFSPADIEKVTGAATKIFGPVSLTGKVKGSFTALKPGERADTAGIPIETVSAYNTDKSFHPKAAGNLGYIVTIGGLRVYHAGDTDVIEEMKDIKADVALLPVGGNYTMDASDACQAAKILKPRAAVPMHYGSIVGSDEDAIRFKNLCLCDVRVLARED